MLCLVAIPLNICRKEWCGYIGAIPGALVLVLGAPLHDTILVRSLVHDPILATAITPEWPITHVLICTERSHHHIRDKLSLLISIFGPTWVNNHGGDHNGY